MQMNLLRRISQMSAPLDVKFTVYRRLREHQESSSLSSMQGVDRVLFDQHQEQSETKLVTCYKTHYEIWSHMLSMTPDVGAVVKLGFKLETAMEDVSKHLTEMLRINPQSSETLFTLSRFYSELQHNKAKADMYKAMARRAQAHTSKHQDMPVASLRVGMVSKSEVNDMDESVCVLQLSAEAATVGEVVTANRATVKLFGRHPNQIIGDNVSLLMPQPFRDLHDTFLLRYIASGKETMMNTTRLVFILRRDKCLAPVWMTIRAAPPVLGDTRPLFAGIMQSVNSIDAHIIVTSQETSYRIRAACARSQALLGIDGDTIEEEQPSLGRWIPEFSSGLILPSSSSDEIFKTRVFDEEQALSTAFDEDHEGFGISFNCQTLEFPGAETSFLVCWRPDADEMAKSGTPIAGRLRRIYASKTIVVGGVPGQQFTADTRMESNASFSGAVPTTSVPYKSSANVPQVDMTHKSQCRSGQSSVCSAENVSRTLGTVLSSLHMMRQSSPAEAKLVKWFYAVMVALIVMFASVFGYLSSSRATISHEMEVIDRGLQALVFDAAVARAFVEIALLEQEGFVVIEPDPAFDFADAILERTNTFQDSLNRVDRLVTTDWPETHDAWSRPIHANPSLDSGTSSVLVTTMELGRSCEVLLNDIILKLRAGRIDCNDENILTFRRGILTLSEFFPSIPWLLSQDFSAAEAHISMVLNIIVGGMFAVLLLLIIGFVLPVLRRLERRTVGIIEQLIHLSPKHLRTLSIQAAAQLDTQIGAAVLLTGQSVDDDDVCPTNRSRHDSDVAHPGGASASCDVGAPPNPGSGRMAKFVKARSLRHFKEAFGRSSEKGRVQPAGLPHFKNSWKFVSIALARFSIPLLAVVIWLVVLYMSSINFQKNYRAVHGWTRLALEYSQASQSAAGIILPYVLTGDTFTGKPIPEHFQEFLSVATKTERIFSKGGMLSDLEGTVPPLSRDSMQFRLFFVNGCQGLDLPSTNPETGECFSSITLGYASANRMLLQTTRDLMGLMMRDYAGSAIDYSPPGTACRGPGSAAATQLLRSWALQVADVSEVQKVILTTFLDDFHVLTTSYSTLVNSVVSVFVVGFVILIVVFGFTTIRDITRVLHLSVSMILLLPENVLLENPELFRMVVALVKSNDGSHNVS